MPVPDSNDPPSSLLDAIGRWGAPYAITAVALIFFVVAMIYIFS